MGKHLNPLEKEFLVNQYKRNPNVSMNDFCIANGVTVQSMRKWSKQYEAGGIEGLARADSGFKDVLPDGANTSVEGYRREILRLRIENERLKKNYTTRVDADGKTEYIPLKTKSSK